MPEILVVEDERDIRDVLRRYLERAGFAVLTTGSGAEALTLMETALPDLVLLDLGLPDIDGTEVLRAAHTRIPVIVLTARAGVDDRIRGLQLGADDYVVKPFSPTEVVLRVQAVLARGLGGEAPQAPNFGQGVLVIDEVKHEVRVRGQQVDLTPTEWGILRGVGQRAGPGLLPL